ncbi:hypothetical protein K443DRAFT_368194 [Laccaria amethystina LaAM-08-1]|uniref:Cytidine deaminase n=1 Tax=Laccaria amethystina LaAM-08-1 TaxID=1095629 RepID=A0A0C9XJL4_9AGAR|nr:hypothetical protein K443DRAFT_368194 [Laccaria amethystina LaAM-08-1]
MAPTLTTEQRTKLILGALEAKERAYSPYSKFPVGAALLTRGGTIVKGASIDNASYGETICAERTAIVKAVSDGVQEFIGLAVVANINSPIPPCGICRQVIREFCALDMPILLVPGNYPRPSSPALDFYYMEGGVRETKLDLLLP